MRKVLLIGWDGAAWERIHPLLDAGAMPNLARVVEGGVMGELRSYPPPVPAMLWTTVATGVPADRHGVLDGVEPDSRTGGLRAVTQASLQVRMMWDLLEERGVGCRVAGWPATHPAKGPGVLVSDRWFRAEPKSVWPEELAQSLESLRFGAQEFTGNELTPFVPRMAEVDQDKDKRLARLAAILADAVSTQAVATELMKEGGAGLTAVWFGAIGQATAVFPEGCDEIYKDVVAGVYRFLDMMLGRLRELAGEDAVVMVVSDRSGGGRGWHPEDVGGPGILCAAGPGVAKDELVFGAGLLDIAPTVLGVLGFEAATGMAGHGISEITGSSRLQSPDLEAEARGPERLKPNSLDGLYDTADVVDETDPPSEADSDALRDELAALAEMGYSDSVMERQRRRVRMATLRREHNLARFLLGQGRAAEAVPVLERLVAAVDDASILRLYLAYAYKQAGRMADFRSVCERLLEEMPQWRAAPLVRAQLAISEGQVAEAKREMHAQSDYGAIAAAWSGVVWAEIGERVLERGDCAGAEDAFRAAIRMDSSLAAAHEGLARVLLAEGKAEQAAEAALDAVRLKYELAAAHRTLGAALRAMGRGQAADEAFAKGAQLEGRS